MSPLASRNRVGCWLIWCCTAGSVIAQEIDFNRDIRPILSNACYKCHGPDAAERKGGTDGLRLDTPEGAFALVDGQAAIVPGKPAESELWRRVTTADADLQMPPASEGRRLTPKEIQLVRRWIEEGARYAKHWSYVPPVRSALPAVRQEAWSQNPVDRFLLARQEREGLQPSEAAEPHAIARRVALDLTGLPPAWEDVEAFAADPRPDAYDRLVDRLLVQPAFGEHWARMWLDLARYADSAGYADDPPRTIWGYRDYVIGAFNANVPFDQFTIEQLAGDLLPGASAEQRMATAFHRNTMTNSEGGTNDEEFRNVAIVDRVNTTWTVWMGTSMACCQCHNHKYDPLSQRDFFQFFAILNNTQDADRRDESPLLEYVTVEHHLKRGLLDRRQKELQQQFQGPRPEFQSGWERWLDRVPVELGWHTPSVESAKSSQGAKLKVLADRSVQVEKPQKQDTYELELAAGDRISAIRLEALPAAELPRSGPGWADGNFRITGFSATLVTPGAEKPTPIDWTEIAANRTTPEQDLRQLLKNPDPKSKGWSPGGAPGQRHYLQVALATPLDAPAGSRLRIRVEQQSSQESQVLGRFRILITGHPEVASSTRTPESIRAILALPGSLRTAADQQTLWSHYLQVVAPELQSVRDELASVNRQLAEWKPATVPVLQELKDDQRRRTNVQRRGNFQDLAEEVTPGLPATLHPLPAGWQADRLGMARWIVHRDNPLTARVFVNRVWEQIFGVGLVRTVEEFGSQGELPSHPELLDWLAVEFMESGWDVKELLRLLVTSAAYRQSSRVDETSFERDPENRWLARGPRFRLTAEMVRDQALAVSGLLSSKVGGPSVKPPQPALGLRAAFGSAIDWQTSAGEDRFRRGLYTEWRRSNPYPSMLTFDAPSREVCTVRRPRTNTPLQALVTLNDPVFIECAQAMARQLERTPGAVSDKVRRAFQVCLTRPPYPAELARLESLYHESVREFVAAPDRARQLATEPIGPAPAGTDNATLAAWTVVANVLLNLDETLMKR